MLLQSYFQGEIIFPPDRVDPRLDSRSVQPDIDHTLSAKDQLETISNLIVNRNNFEQKKSSLGYNFFKTRPKWKYGYMQKNE